MVAVTDAIREPVAGSDGVVLASQPTISAEIRELAAAETRARSTTPGGLVQPRLDYPPYRSSMLRHPTKALQQADPEAHRARWRRSSATPTSTPSSPT